MSLGVTQQQNGVSTVPLYLSPLLDTGFHREELHRPGLRHLRLILRESQVQADYGFPCQDIPPLHPSPSGDKAPGRRMISWDGHTDSWMQASESKVARRDTVKPERTCRDGLLG